MYKIQIRNSQNVVTNTLVQESNEIQHHDSYGKPERELTAIQAFEEGLNILDASSSRVGETVDGSVTLYTFSATYTIEVEDISVQLASQQESEQALQYLKDTDFYIIREIDAGIPCPQEIKVLRAAARLKVL